MDIRLLPLTEFHSVYFFRMITLAILVLLGGFTLFHLTATPLSEITVVALCVLLMAWRFTVEWLRVGKSAPAFIHNDELVVSSADGHRQIPLTKIRSITSRHSLFMVRRYRSWSEHLAFLQLTLHSGERIHTLAESAVLEFPAGKQTLSALRTAVLDAKTKSLSTQQPASTR
ncbi:hypothetical protein H3H51_07475 [Pseudomonas sp. UL070]|uniref:Uncharacterized protein n=2 Tax=Aquipseudomonas ullengensis TaxID=2759166 RepID=A0A7W4LKI1_9GAMM|nr:hypothetical protein [Pseudomonas ullengensis]